MNMQKGCEPLTPQGASVQRSSARELANDAQRLTDDPSEWFPRTLVPGNEQRMNSQPMLMRDLVVEEPSHAKAVSARLPYDLIYLSSALDPQLFSIFVWRGNQNLNQDVTSNRRTDCALDQRPVERNIGGKTGAGVLTLFLPVEDRRQLTAIPCRRFVWLSVIRNHEKLLHRRVFTMPERRRVHKSPNV